MEIFRGLEGVHIDTTHICSIDGQQGELIYSGYNIHELADKATYEEVVWLLWHGELPTQAELADFKTTLASNYSVPEAVYDLLRSVPKDTQPMHAIRSALSVLATFDDHSEDTSVESVKAIGIKLVAQFPTITAAYQRIRNGQDPVAPDSNLGIAANFLYMLTGDAPSDAAVRVMDVALVLHAEHGSNASTFTARAAASSLTDVYSAITAAMASLKGPLHGGANTAVMHALEEIGSKEGVEDYVLTQLAKPHGRVMGFGHRVYKVLDPRAVILRHVAEELSEESGESKWFEMSLEMERVMDREMEAKGREVKPNVDFFSASVYRMLGFPGDMYTPIFAVARVSGWMAHLIEQYANNKIMRPRLVYEGERNKTFTPIDAR
jgi:citrate synthase